MPRTDTAMEGGRPSRCEPFPSTFPGKIDTGQTDNFTFGLWVRLISKPGNVYLMFKTIDGNHYGCLLTYDSTADAFVAKVGGTPPGDWWTYNAVSSKTPLSVDTWYLVVFRLDNGTLRINVGADGDTSTVEDSMAANPCIQSTGGLVIGNQYETDCYFDEAFVFSDVLTKAEIDEILYHGLDGTRRAGVDKALADSGSGADLMTIDRDSGHCGDRRGI